MASDIVVSVDIGTTKIVCLVAQETEQGKINILGIGQADTPENGVLRGAIANVPKTAEAIRKAVDIAQKQANITIQKVFVGIAGQHIQAEQRQTTKARTNPEKDISQQDIDILMEEVSRLAKKPEEEVLHIIPQEYMIDVDMDIKDPIGMCGTKITGNYLVVSGSSTSIRNLERCVEVAGLENVGTVLEPIASAHCALTKEEKEAGMLLIDMGGGTTNLAVYYDGILRDVFVVPFGGEIITNDIKKHFKIINTQAELIKTSFGSALEPRKEEDIILPGINEESPEKHVSKKELSQVIQARLEEIVDMIFTRLVANGNDRLIVGVSLTGGGSLLQLVGTFIHQRYELNVRMVKASQYAFLEEKSKEKVDSPIYSTALGLALEAIRHSKKNPALFQVIPEIEPEPEIKVNPEPEPKNIEETPKAPKKNIVKNLFGSIINFLDN